MGKTCIFFDGGARPQVGAGAAIVIHEGSKHPAGKVLGVVTNNVAEYTGLIVGLKKAIDLGATELIIKGDSQLVVNQVNGDWGVNKPHLMPLCDEAQSLLKRFNKWHLSWIPRDQNYEADAVCNKIMDESLGIAADPNPVAVPLTGNSQIDRINKLGRSASFKDFSALKVPSGKDKYTSIRLPQLREMVASDSIKTIEATWERQNGLDVKSGKPEMELDDRALATTLRWHLRGLTLDLAIRKVRTSLEIERNCVR